MRLIDLDAKEPYLLDGRYSIGIPGNVSTVEPNDTMFKEWFCPDCQERKNSYKAGYKQAIIDGKTNYSRPQGEWKTPTSIFKGNYFCNNCNGFVIDKSKYCPNCGAEMRGKEE